MLSTVARLNLFSKHCYRTRLRIRGEAYKVFGRVLSLRGFLGVFLGDNYIEKANKVIEISCGLELILLWMGGSNHRMRRVENWLQFAWKL